MTLGSTLSHLTYSHRLNESKLAFRSALCDSFNTPEALKLLRDLVSRTNVYINTRGKSINVALVEQSARWVGNMLRMFGLGEGEKIELGWGQETTSDANAANVSIHVSTMGPSHPLRKREELLLPYLRVLSSFRDGVRQLAIAKGDDSLKEILKLCDRFRDEDLVPLGVALDDQEGITHRLHFYLC